MDMLKYYRNCDEIPIFNLYRILESKDFSYMYLDYDGYNTVKIEKGINEVWDKIYQEYLNLIGDNTTLIYYELVNDLLYLETRYSVASSLLQQIALGGMSKEMTRAYVLELRNWKYKIDDKKPLQSELERMVRQLRGSENKIRIKKEEKKALEEGSTNEKMTLIEQQVKLEQALSRNEIDTKKTVASKWITMIKEVKLINEQRQKKNGK
ncbi:hypothetical protein AVT42_gp25 [Polaribacter phage P12002S]|uniref:Uncharacterized protein n=1 Tax=Polaribacter phage P12002S TaxID=1647387 RepID=A0A0F7DD24_9CAUD|nr:hypothetical protein AVT42_gp25 [Polaribacter phage P12002S]AKG94281.1 hypothetical protein P12002S_0025 [Polaribacter phage P12002S]